MNINLDWFVLNNIELGNSNLIAPTLKTSSKCNFQLDLDFYAPVFLKLWRQPRNQRDHWGWGPDTSGTTGAEGAQRARPLAPGGPSERGHWHQGVARQAPPPPKHIRDQIVFGTFILQKCHASLAECPDAIRFRKNENKILHFLIIRGARLAG